MSTCKLSVIIVNYNVQYFLEQSLHSVQKALLVLKQEFPENTAEVFVVDNHSEDDSVRMVQEKFPEFKLIVNEENRGYAAANNQALKQAEGEYVLLLNPDTVVEEDTFLKTVQFMEEHPEAGGVGVRMIDGQGNFLPESKRSFPSPLVAFYKLFGLSYLFPQSKTFGKYHLGYLSEDEVHEVEVLSGAFMMLRKATIEETGLLDESFFMYGEDIDLSYRIMQQGYKNYYFPKTRIIHYKGESTKKESFNYVRLFYNAMHIFARKHFSHRKAWLFQGAIQIAIVFRAVLSFFNRGLRKIAFPLLDAGLLYGGMYLLKEYWEAVYRYPEGGSYPQEFILILVPVYIGIWLLSIFFSGGYDRPIKLNKIVRGTVGGTLLIFIIYAFLPEDWRFSRALVLMGGAWAILSMSSTRIILNYFRKGALLAASTGSKKILVVGDENEGDKVKQLLDELGLEQNYIGLVRPNKNDDANEKGVGSLTQLKEIVNFYNANELIFCAKSIPSTEIIQWMTTLGPTIEYKIMPEKSWSVIGSNSTETSGELYTVDVNLNLLDPSRQRNKRLLDISLALSILCTYPLLFWIYQHKRGVLQNCSQVIRGQATWVGYIPLKKNPGPAIQLPAIRQGILTPLDDLNKKPHDQDALSRANFLYAKDYTLFQDLKIISKNIPSLGRR